jgi:hypothetical protein
VIHHQQMLDGVYPEGLLLPNVVRGRYYRWRVVIVTAARGAERASEWSRPVFAESPVPIVRRRRREKRARGLKLLGAIPE